MSENMGKVVVCIPLIQGNGSKYIATNLANYYKAKYNDKKVALVDFDFKLPYLAHSLSSHDEIHGIDNVIDKIDGGFLSNDLFNENMIKLKNNVDLLKGTKLIGHHKMFNKRHIESILERLRDMYDLIVIAVSPYADNAGTVYSLFNADEVILVCRNNIANHKALERTVETVKEFFNSDKKLKLVFNMYNDNTQVSFNQQLRNFNIDVIGAIKYDENTIDNNDLLGSAFKVFKGKNKSFEVYEPIVKSFED